MRRIASGTLAEVARAAKEFFDRNGGASILVFDDLTSEQIDLDFSISAEESAKRLTPAGGPGEPAPASPETGVAARGPGRPRLGVVAREVTLLPRHWEWLGGQPGGASVALRKLVEQARKANESRDRQRRAQEAAYRFMSAVAGNLAGFEEAIRALFAADRARFDEMTAPWPPDVGGYARKLASDAFVEVAS
jgi:hypothetical protein